MIALWGGATEPECLLETFARTADAHPGALAVVHDTGQISYAQLGSWAAEIQAMLAGLGVQPGDRIAVAGPRSAPIIAAMLAIVSMGATYVPLDTAYPLKRLAHVVADSGAQVVLHSGAAPDLGTGPPLARIPGFTPTAGPTRGRTPQVACAAGADVYVIYTSGSTGRPKGVALPHSCIDNMAHWQVRHSIRPDLRTAQFAPLGFDVWFQETLGTLCGGGTVVVMPEPLRRDPLALLDWLAAERIERLFLPCVALHMLAAAADDVTELSTLSLLEVNTAGEQLVCTPAIRSFFRRLPGCRLNNHYGQSESAMVTAHTLTGAADLWPTLPPIGRPLPGCEVLCDNADPGVPEVGELLVTGLPLSSGYLNQPALNAERFIEVPRTPQGHTRAFRTGDLVRIDDGVIHFISRVDHELKIRGYRVNPLEVDACLMAQPGIAEAVSVAVEVAAGSRHLRAAVTVTDGPAFDPAHALRELREHLPVYSLPQSITVLAELPRTPSGKVDRDAVGRLLARRPQATR